MGLWSAYFFAKLLLFAGGYIDFDVWLNLAFAVLTALPSQNARQKFAKNLVAVPLGIILLYHDTWLPPVDRLLAQATGLAAFTPAYLLELLGRFVRWKVVLELIAMLAVYSLARRKLRLSTFVFIGIFTVMLLPRGLAIVERGAAAPAVAGAAPQAAQEEIDPRNMRPEALDALLTSFYAKEEEKRVRFQPTEADDALPFDILFLHVCSLSWDDLQATRRENDPFFKRFDILFSRFNSAASYSGPAALRFLRSSCGQASHKALYDSPRTECLLIDGLQNVGFEPWWLMNHDGHFGDFRSTVRDLGGLAVTPADIQGAQLVWRAFDDSPIYGDYSVLSRWWARRDASPSPRVVLYYNTITLHDGNRMADGSRATFETRVGRFLSEVGRFMDDVKASGRRVIIVFVPEHGAAVRGDRRQIPGLREIPSPAITQVPVGVALINANRGKDTVPQRIDAPASYLALAEVLSRMHADNPFSPSSRVLATHTQNLPQTESVAENEGSLIMHIGRRDMLRTPDGAWTEWDAGR